MDDFDLIFQRTSPIVYHFLLSLCRDEHLADELTAETFYQAYQHIGAFRGDCRIETWLCQIAKNALYKELHRQKRTVSLDGSPPRRPFRAACRPGTGPAHPQIPP